jgi:hypothetical protein
VNYGHHCRSTAKAGKNEVNHRHDRVQYCLPLCIRAAATQQRTPGTAALAEHQQQLRTAWTGRAQSQHFSCALNPPNQPHSLYTNTRPATQHNLEFIQHHKFTIYGVYA